MVVETAYQDFENINNAWVRVFDNPDSQNLVWHRDKKSRAVKVLSGNGWFLQIDNELPIELQQGKIYFIPALVFHRLINTEKSVLEIQITEQD
jgi:quercetin dioxygenase-like cupin family protein